MLNPIVTNVLAADHRRRLLHVADTRQLINSTTVTDASATPLPIVADERSTRKTTSGASRKQ